MFGDTNTEKVIWNRRYQQPCRDQKSPCTTVQPEHGCKNCGFAFCKKCLTKATAVPKLGNKKCAVCDKCYNVLTGKTPQEDSATKFEPPDALLKRLAALDQGNANKADSKTATAVKKQPSKHRGLTSEDAAMVARLEKLKENRTTAPSQSDIEARLAKLKQDQQAAAVCTEDELSNRLAKFKGQDPKIVNQRFIHTSDHRSEQQQIDSLLEEISDEVMIDDHLAAAAVGDIHDRLNKLKQDSVRNNFDETAHQSDNPCHSTSCTMNIPPSAPSLYGSKDPSLAEIDKLMREAAAEAQAEADRAIEGMKKDNELWSRVQQLKDVQRSEQHVEADSESTSSNEESEKAANFLIRGILEERVLDDKCEDINNKVSPGQVSTVNKSVCRSTADADDNADDKELPWCCICNNDATLRCAGCDGDLYCQRCYREGHDRFEKKEHRTSPYTSPATRRT